MRSSNNLVPTLFLSFVVACSAADADTGEQGSMEKVDPRGNDTPGSILLKTPSADGVLPATYYVDAQKMVPLNTLLPNLPVGRTSMSLIADWLSSNFTVDVAAGKTTTLTAALLGIQLSGGPRTLGLETDRGDDGYDLRFYGDDVPSSFTDGASRVPVFGGTYRVSWGMLDGVMTRLDAGANTLISPTDMADRRVTRISTTKGEYPAACKGEHGWRFKVVKPRAYDAFRSWDGKEIDLGISLENEGHRHLLTSDMWTNEQPIPEGERGAGPLSWKIGVIDVDDVLINEAAPRVPGTWAVFVAHPKSGDRIGSNLLKCLPTTKTSAPVPPGHYRVEVYYDTVEAGRKTDVHIIDI